jgi:NADH-quinone oxidoreductase subunit K
MSALTLYQIVALILLCAGLFCLTQRRSLVGMLISVELMLNGAGLSMVAAAQLTDFSAVLGQLGTLFIMGLAAAEATLVLAMIVVVARRFKSAKSSDITTLKE